MKHIAIVLGATLALALAGPALAQSPIVIKFSHVVAPDTPKGKGSLKFKELGERYTNGKVVVEVYPNSQLYKDNEELQALQLGAVQMLAPSLAKFGPLGVKEFEVFDLPFILPNKAALRKVTDGPLGKKLMGLLEPKGIVGLAYWDNGFKDMSANKPLRMPADFRAGITKAMAEATAFTNDIAQKENDDALEEIKKSGKSQIIALTPEQKAAWRKALEPVYTEMVSRVGKDILAEFEKEVNSVSH